MKQRIFLKMFPHYRQIDSMDCGPACLKMIAKHYGRTFSLQSLRSKCGPGKEGVSMFGLLRAAESIGLHSGGIRASWEDFRKSVPLPCIVHWNQHHFVVVYKISKRFVYVADPEKNKLRYTNSDFIKYWVGENIDDSRKGFALLLKPTPEFYQGAKELVTSAGFSFLLKYTGPFKGFACQLILGLFMETFVQMVFPICAQRIVDVGIHFQDINFIYLILFGQLMLLAGKAGVAFVRNWILLYVSTRINVYILSDFLIKLMKLPIPYFDTKMTGDILQRISDQQRIENFLTGSALNILFAIFNLIAFTVLLASYNANIFFTFFICSVLYFTWIWIFLGRRRSIDFLKFEVSARNQSGLIQLIHGMQEIRLNNCETEKRWEWEQVQAELFKVNAKSLSLTQSQKIGAFIINEGKNIFITFYAASCVIHGDLSLGGMLAIQYIIGALNGPIEQMIGFVQTSQDARLSLERLNEIHDQENEEGNDRPLIQHIPADRPIKLKDVCFSYPGSGDREVLRNINISIPYGKMTAIVGMSGSGKTTLLKLLLKFYKPNQGEIYIGSEDFNNISHTAWRRKCGVVMQDGFIFSDTVRNNIAVVNQHINHQRLANAVITANLHDLIENLPNGLDTKIGPEGYGISQGQRQRILIARSVYKQPEFIFFDEATNALDANNERVIMENLEKFFIEKTVVVVAHRLSTVKNAAHIIVLDQGEIIEYGNHRELTAMRGRYYTLVKNQLELDA